MPYFPVSLVAKQGHLIMFKSVKCEKLFSMNVGKWKENFQTLQKCLKNGGEYFQSTEKEGWGMKEAIET